MKIFHFGQIILYMGPLQEGWHEVEEVFDQVMWPGRCRTSGRSLKIYENFGPKLFQT